ncbi:MAG: hypothetical protein BWY96_02445 [Spirochaetes bacterium ADurb.BinA120]|nr:MAG: hypothetical protein BWY96_02445 [Spirochaetes bacterium ADurb.BinA120]
MTPPKAGDQRGENEETEETVRGYSVPVEILLYWRMEMSPGSSLPFPFVSRGMSV